MIATEVRVTCPRCKRAEITPLAREGDRQRFTCNSCGENFSGPAVQQVEEPRSAVVPEKRFSYVPIAIPESTPVLATCEKCGKPYYKTGKRFEAHVAACDGKKYVAPKKRAPRTEALPTPPSVIYEQTLQSLRARREALQAELDGLDLAIERIEKLKGAGGAAPVPFVPAISQRASLPA